MHSHSHIHYHPSTEGINKDTVVSELTSLKPFGGFDDFMYYAYKHWLFIKTENLVDSAKTAFDSICTKYNKLKNPSQKDVEINAFETHMDRALGFMKEHALHEATEEVENFVGKYVIKEKFLRNFNKRVGGHEHHHHH